MKMWLLLMLLITSCPWADACSGDPTEVKSTSVEPLIVTIKKGEIAEFLCAPIQVGYMKYYTRSAYDGDYAITWGTEMYLCDEDRYSTLASTWGSNTNSFGKYQWFNVEKYIHDFDCDKAPLMKVKLQKAATTDMAGKYWCMWSTSGKDYGQKVDLRVVTPNPVVTETEDEMEVRVAEWMEPLGTSPEAKKALWKCKGNRACALAVLQRNALNVTDSCWWCLQMEQVWKVAPLTSNNNILSETGISSELPCSVRQFLAVNQTGLKKSECTEPDHRYVIDYLTRPLQVSPNIGKLCLCRMENDGQHLGQSMCNDRVNMSADGLSCAYGTENRTCPFNIASKGVASVLWVCGERGFHRLLSRPWTGCCYPAVMLARAAAYVAKPRRQKRSLLGSGDMPEFYQGALLMNPWTSPMGNVLWNILPYIGNTLTMTKLNGLAWQVLVLANTTEKALGLLNEEMHQIRDAVIQNRLLLDMLTAEKGGVCTVLEISCCFFIPDYADNVTDLIVHMKNAIREPPDMTNPVLQWWNSSGWGSWFLHVLLPIAIAFVLIMLLLPCLLKLCQRAVTQLIL